MSDIILPRRSFLQTCIALAAAPAIIRFDSLMPLAQVFSADWRNYVREVMQYQDGEMLGKGINLVRFDIAFNKDGKRMQYHCDARLEGSIPVQSVDADERIRRPALHLLEDILQHHNVRAADLQMLSLPRGNGWARNGVVLA